ncbi:hypothetical protein TI39_contig343g00024 [Zymoseptoria brevis]|uniref:MYND-type domain-containing protein n=1 Tax=Zymoseptoria brevis TaxID=1047168 RepID=A0A0F4GSS3_9PEZI|nr:hypothetical protein TI39_contig343g00024 [Zymoseptoria brevis]
MPAAMTATERARLFKLGQGAKNLYYKHWFSLAESAGSDGIDMDLAARMFSHDANKLLIVGELLGKDGKEFVTGAQGIMAQYMMFRPDLAKLCRETAADKAECYRNPRGFTPAEIAYAYEHMTKRSRISNSTANKSLHEVAIDDHTIWLHDDLMGIPPPAGEEKKQSCTYCGLKSNKERVMMACGRCNAALYCDRLCQKLDWKCKRGPFCDKACKENHSKKEHKAICAQKANEKKEAGTESV